MENTSRELNPKTINTFLSTPNIRAWNFYIVPINFSIRKSTQRQKKKLKQNMEMRKLIIFQVRTFGRNGYAERVVANARYRVRLGGYIEKVLSRLFLAFFTRQFNICEIFF